MTLFSPKENPTIFKSLTSKFSSSFWTKSPSSHSSRSPHERLPPALLDDVTREALEEARVLALVDGPEHGGGRPTARVDHGAVGDAAAHVGAGQAGRVQPALGRVHDDGVGHEDDGQVEAEDAVLALGGSGGGQAGQGDGLER